MTLDLFQTAKVEIEKPVPMTEVKLGHHSARVPLQKQRRAALTKLMDILANIEGKDISIGSYDAGGKHYWLNNLKLQRLRLEYHPFPHKEDTGYIPSVVVLWGSRDACIRIFTDYLVDVRTRNIWDIGFIFSTFVTVSGKVRSTTTAHIMPVYR